MVIQITHLWCLLGSWLTSLVLYIIFSLFSYSPKAMFTLDIKGICWNAVVPVVGIGIRAAQAAIHKLLSHLVVIGKSSQEGFGILSCAPFFFVVVCLLGLSSWKFCLGWALGICLKCSAEQLQGCAPKRSFTDFLVWENSTLMCISASHLPVNDIAPQPCSPPEAGILTFPGRISHSFSSGVRILVQRGGLTLHTAYVNSTNLFNW